MQNLTPSEVTFVYNSVFYTFIIGFGFFIVSMFMITFFFGLGIREVAQKSKFFIGLLVFSLLTPMIVGQLYGRVQYSQAATSVKITNMIVKDIDKSTYLVTFKSSEPVYSYLVYTDKESDQSFPVMPVDNYEKKTDHTFVVSAVGKKGGEAVIVINSQKYLLDGKPITIPGE